MQGRVIWVTGLSGAGKTTLCAAVRQQLQADPCAVVTLDGDVVREIFDGEVGYTEADRTRHIRRMQRLAKVVSEQGCTVLVAALYSNPELLAWNRAHLPGYIEVYLRASVAALARRDSKGLYGAYSRGHMIDVVGCDIPFAEPTRADIVFDVDELVDIRQMATAVVERMVATAAAGASR